jgi:predicted RND superfamily exporter protein
MQIDRATAATDMRLYGALRIHYNSFGTGPKIGTVRLPNFKENNEMYSKTESTRSDEEILEAMRELAKKHVENGTFHNVDNEYLDLMKEYISSASPDRESILTSSLNQIFGKTNKSKEEPTIDFNQSILQQTIKSMEQMKTKNKTASEALKQISNAMYGKLNITNDNKLNYVEFYSSSGEMMATYDSSIGWASYLTKEEKVRNDEILAVYNETFRSNYDTPTASLPKSITSGNSFDVVA